MDCGGELRFYLYRFSPVKFATVYLSLDLVDLGGSLRDVVRALSDTQDGLLGRTGTRGGGAIEGVCEEGQSEDGIINQRRDQDNDETQELNEVNRLGSLSSGHLVALTMDRLVNEENGDHETPDKTVGQNSGERVVHGRHELRHIGSRDEQTGDRDGEGGSQGPNHRSR